MKNERVSVQDPDNLSMNKDPVHKRLWTTGFEYHTRGKSYWKGKIIIKKLGLFECVSELTDFTGEIKLEIWPEYHLRVWLKRIVSLGFPCL